eukprot:4099713-Pleurochrysis_carterae.AAC.1
MCFYVREKDGGGRGLAVGTDRAVATVCWEGQTQKEAERLVPAQAPRTDAESNANAEAKAEVRLFCRLQQLRTQLPSTLRSRQSSPPTTTVARGGRGVTSLARASVQATLARESKAERREIANAGRLARASRDFAASHRVRAHGHAGATMLGGAAGRARASCERCRRRNSPNAVWLERRAASPDVDVHAVRAALSLVRLCVRDANSRAHSKALSPRAHVRKGTQTCIGRWLFRSPEACAGSKEQRRNGGKREGGGWRRHLEDFVRAQGRHSHLTSSTSDVQRHEPLHTLDD